MAIENPYYTADVHGPSQTHDVGDLVLEEGDTLRGCRLAYTTLGELNAAKDNAILVPTWYSGNYSVTCARPWRATRPSAAATTPRPPTSPWACAATR